MLKRTFYILLLFISIKAVGQRTNASPYSFFGIGEEYRFQTAEQASMGGIGISFSDNYHLNLMNPAGNAHLRFATYALGVNAKNLTIKDFSGSQSSTSSSLSYLALGFPIGKKAGATFGIQPNTSVGYSLFNLIKDANGDITESTRFYGIGGTSRIFGSFGMFLMKDLSVGVEAGYVFGKTENNVVNQRTGVHLGTKHREVTNVRGAGVKLGVQYQKELANKLVVSMGATINFENKLNTKGSEYFFSLAVNAAAVEIPRDTLSNISISGTIINPMKTGLGIGLGKPNKWYAGLEYEFQAALDIQGSIISSSTSYAYGNSNKLSLGGFYLPKVNSISSYWERVTYRAGIRFEKTGLLISTTPTTGGFTDINDFGISFGLGLPLGKRLSDLNLGLDYGKKGTTANNLIQENYFNFRLSLSLSDKWFKPRRID